MALKKATTVANGLCEAISSAASPPAAAAPAVILAASPGSQDGLQSQALIATTRLLPEPNFGADMKEVMVNAAAQLKGEHDHMK